MQQLTVWLFFLLYCHRFSMFNHSCDYNCVAIHNGTSMSVRATRDILANKEVKLRILKKSSTQIFKNQEYFIFLFTLLNGILFTLFLFQCFVCYVDVLKPTASRNAILRKVFQFMCKCHTCRDTKRVRSDIYKLVYA